MALSDLEEQEDHVGNRVGNGAMPMKRVLGGCVVSGACRRRLGEGQEAVTGGGAGGTPICPASWGHKLALQTTSWFLKSW